uniref:RWP-RK domain-containing protein n=1 Tax=Hemiselmis andersenii TaxID=464988 RepID=A0A6U4LXW6_HEMAN|mmetsp:Transcript_7336/g.16806  ORF Transcript_7336/g.16806 Transcript_7336/m.16806 type:complete len:473 (-) Transcript_7336:351-1769(-)
MPTHRVVTMDELTQYLHLPEKAVAKQLGICLTSLKKLCRQHGITRWPYRKLKSLDKKIAKAENGTGVGTEDASQLKIKAEELKKEKMAVAFTYGLKEKPDGGGLEFVPGGAVGAAAGGDGTIAKSADGTPIPPPPKPAPKAKKPKTSASAAAAEGGDEWPLHIGMDGESPHGIPTPPDEGGHSPMPDGEGEEDLFGDELSRQALDENGMHPIGTGDDEHTWVAPDGEPLHHTVGDVEVVAAEAKGGGSKEAAVKISVLLPGGLAAGKGKAGVKDVEVVSEADLQIASALASSVNTPNSGSSHDTDDSGGTAPPPAAARKAEDNKQPQFDVEAPGDHAFHHDMMDSEFFSALPHAHDPEDHEEAHHHTTCLEVPIRDEHSPSSASLSSNSTVKDEDMCALAPEHTISTLPSDLAWSDEAHAWFSPDTPDKKEKGGDAASQPGSGEGPAVSTRSTRSRSEGSHSPSKASTRAAT